MLTYKKIYKKKSKSAGGMGHVKMRHAIHETAQKKSPGRNRCGPVCLAELWQEDTHNEKKLKIYVQEFYNLIVCWWHSLLLF